MYISPVSNYHLNNINFKNKKIPVYAIDSNGNYQRFNSRLEASKELGITAPEINRSAAKRFHRAGGFFFVDADKIEKRSDNGEIVVFQKDIDELIENRTLNREIYAIDSQGNYLKFPSQLDASKELKIDRREISSAIAGHRKRAKGLYFVPASKIESKDVQGRIYVDREKINDVIQDKPLHPIYAVDSKGNYIKFPNQAKAAEEMGVSRQRISQVIGSKTCINNGYYFIPASKIESKDEDGQIFVDPNKLQEVLIEKSLSIG